MSTIPEILQRAQQRAKELGLSYKGALTPSEAYQILQNVSNSRLIDVRTRAELELVGRIPNALHIEFAFYPGMMSNPHFLAEASQQLSVDDLNLFICRTGGRSHNAATLVTGKLGFTNSYNILEGFEGEAVPDSQQRGKINGWKKADLPWTNAQ